MIDKDYDEISVNQITGFDEKYRIEFTQDYVQKDTLALLENTCSICRQQQTFPEFKQLIDHAKEIHGKYYCLICSKFKKLSYQNYHYTVINNYKDIKVKVMEMELELELEMTQKQGSKVIQNVNIVMVKGFIQKMN